jgi:hypothetical protein
MWKGMMLEVNTKQALTLSLLGSTTMIIILARQCSWNSDARKMKENGGGWRKERENYIL